mmetsp:Transcript_11736/g.14591  ORF Transcript_11736/g.14591 Transcript_11736/m.14591 type:complete len:99 (-) Transcript_11736:287-583(-)
MGRKESNDDEAPRRSGFFSMFSCCRNDATSFDGVDDSLHVMMKDRPTRKNPKQEAAYVPRAAHPLLSAAGGGNGNNNDDGGRQSNGNGTTEEEAPKSS